MKNNFMADESNIKSYTNMKNKSTIPCKVFDSLL